MRTKISQREARRLRARVRAFELRDLARSRQWAKEYPGGVQIGSVTWAASEMMPVAIRTARLLGHAVVVVERDGQVLFYALPDKPLL